LTSRSQAQGGSKTSATCAVQAERVKEGNRILSAHVATAQCQCHQRPINTMPASQAHYLSGADAVVMADAFWKADLSPAQRAALQLPSTERASAPCGRCGEESHASASCPNFRRPRRGDLGSCAGEWMGLHTYDYWPRAVIRDAAKCLRSGEHRLRLDLVNDAETGERAPLDSHRVRVLVGRQRCRPRAVRRNARPPGAPRCCALMCRNNCLACRTPRECAKQGPGTCEPEGWEWI
jgi:hypothetical protein